MKKLALLTIFASLTSTAVFAAPGFNQITDMATFSQIVVDKPLVRNARTSFTIYSDGTMGGVYNGRELAGTWEWVGDAFCRTLTSPRRAYSCQKITTNGIDARFSPYPRRGLVVVREMIARNN